MNKVEAMPYVKSRGLEFIDAFEGLKDALRNSSEDMEKYVESKKS